MAHRLHCIFKGIDCVEGGCNFAVRMFNFNFMENTNEKNENVTLDTAVDNAVEQVDEIVETGEEEQSILSNDASRDDSPMGVLKRYPKVCERIAELMRERAENMALELLQKGMGYDEAVANADKEGYLRGKNEKIELVKNHRFNSLDELPSIEDPLSETTIFPRYDRRSVWD